MFFDAVIQQKPLDRYRLLESKLEALGRDISVFRKKSTPVLEETISVLENRISNKRFETGFMDFMKDNDYVKDIYTRDALSCLLEYKNARDASVVLVPGMTYYNTKTEGTPERVVGKRCFYISEDHAFWSPVNEDVRVMKAMEVMQWGSDDQFRKVYFELADGRLFESTEDLMLEHITESSNEALDAIEEYCNSLWEGAWPWEQTAPMKLKTAIKENTAMTKKSVQEFRESFTSLVRTLNEGEIERSAVITKMQGYIEDIDNMLEKLGRVSGNLLTDVRENVRAEFGDSAADEIGELVEQHIRGAADELAKLKGAWSGKLNDLISGNTSEPAEFDQDLGGEEEGGDLDLDADPADMEEPDEIDGDLDLGDDDLGDDLELDDEDEGERDKK